MRRISFLATLMMAGMMSIPVYAEGWSGYVSGEYRYFNHDPLYPSQKVQYWSLATQPEYYKEWEEEDRSFTFTPFLRWDRFDERRSHGDIRELNGYWDRGDWQFLAGISRVFWGVTESNHLVDIINQTDTLEGVDGEDKLGQPMLNANWNQDWGNLEMYILLGFRERSYTGENGRIRSPLIVDVDNPVFESDQGNKHIDYAVRWSNSYDIWDIGVYYFYGTSRDPRLEPGLNDQGEPVLIPYYDIIGQLGMDTQVFLGNWTLKLEALNQRRKQEMHSAATGGFEYTFVGVFGSQIDIGTLAEYSHDTRGTASPSPFANDLFAGMRLSPNDAQSTELIAGVVYDLDNSGQVYRIEASRRLFKSWKISFEAQTYSGIDQRDPLLYPVRDDDFFQFDLAWFF